MASRVIVGLLTLAVSSFSFLCVCAPTTHATTGTTTIESSVCSDSHTPALSIASPADNTTIFSNELALTIDTDWIESVRVQRDESILLIQPIANTADQSTTITVSLPQGISTLVITAQGGCPAQTLTATLTVNYTPADASTSPRLTNRTSPALYGTVSSATDYVFIRLAGKRYQATNNGDGTWTLLPGIISPGLTEGTYDITIELENPLGSVVATLLFSDYLRVDLTSPQISLISSQATARSPELRGLVDDPNARVSIILEGREYTATSNGDGTWILPAGLISPDLASGIYEILIRTIDAAGNANETRTRLTIAARGELGFLLAPNTGYMKLGSVHISSWVLYTIATLILLLVALRYFAVHSPSKK